MTREATSIEELFELHQQMQSVLREELIAKKAALEDLLRQLNTAARELWREGSARLVGN